MVYIFIRWNKNIIKLVQKYLNKSRLLYLWEDKGEDGM